MVGVSPTKKIHSDSLQVIEVEAGGKVNMSCNAKVDPKNVPVHYQWRKKGSPQQPPLYFGRFYYINYILDPDHHAEFECRVETAVDSLTTTWKLNVLSQPAKLFGNMSNSLLVTRSGHYLIFTL